MSSHNFTTNAYHSTGQESQTATKPGHLCSLLASYAYQIVHFLLQANSFISHQWSNWLWSLPLKWYKLCMVFNRASMKPKFPRVPVSADGQ